MITRTSHTTADVERRSIRKRMRQLQLRSSSYHQHQHTLVDTGKRNINRGFLLIFFANLRPRLDGSDLDSFLLLREQFLWRIHCDAVKFQVSQRFPAEGEERDAFMYFLHEIDLLYPSVLGTELPSECQAFVAQIFKVATPWHDKDWLKPFLLEDVATPALIKRFGIHEV